MEQQEKPKLDRYLGAIVGAAAGDALGWPNEYNSKNLRRENPKKKLMFQKWIRRNGYSVWGHEEEINPGEYSDDTQLIIATARSLQYGENWDKYFTKIELPAWISYERGGGGATKRAANAWKAGYSPWTGKNVDVVGYFNAGGNGVAMRILPHVFGKEQKPEGIMHQVVLNGIFTHGHPRALVGATLYADALICLVKTTKTLGYGELVDILLERKNIWGKLPNLQKLDDWLSLADNAHKGSYMEIWNTVVGEAVELLQMANEGLGKGALDIGSGVLERLGCFDRKVNGAGTVTAVAAIYLASKYASNPQQAMTEAAYLKNADTDTLASMLGGLLGMLHGSEFISMSWMDVQDYGYLKKLIHLEPKSDNIGNIKDVLDYNHPAFNSKIKGLKPGDCIFALPFNKLIVKEKRPMKAYASGSIIHKLKLVSEAGQSIFITTFEKGQKTKQPQRSVVGQQTLYPDEKPDVPVQPNGKVAKPPLLDSNKVRSMANLLPYNMPSDQCFFFISDIMAELERKTVGGISGEGFHFLLDRWKRFGISKEQIDRVLKVILHY